MLGTAIFLICPFHLCGTCIQALIDARGIFVYGRAVGDEDLIVIIVEYLGREIVGFRGEVLIGD